MARASIARSTSLRVAALYVAFFLVSLLGANVTSYNLIAAYLYERLDSSVGERFEEISSAYEQRGIDGAKAMIASHGATKAAQHTVYTVMTPGGAVVAGSGQYSDLPYGYSTRAPSCHDQSLTNYRFFRGTLGEYDLVVGVSYDDTDRLRKIALISFGCGSAIVLALGLGSGAWFAFRTRSRIASLTGRMKAVGAGELSTRLPVSTRKDEIDTLACEVNSALVQLESSVAAMKQVTTDIAHDLKTPIGRLLLLLEAALDSADRDSAELHIATAMDEVRQIASTFEALLRISQISSGARNSRLVSLHPDEIIREIYEIYQPIAEDAGRRMELAQQDRVNRFAITADRDLLRQLCVNLVANAIRHTHDGAGIRMGVKYSEDTCSIFVADTGPGIPTEERQKVFKRFYRLEKSRTTEGTGLGLSLVKAISDFHEASISLSDNAPGLLVEVKFHRA